MREPTLRRPAHFTNKISTGQSTTAVIWRQSDGVILEKEVIFRKIKTKKKKKNMEENSSRTAPSSTDACNSIVHALMCRRQGGNWADIHIYFFSLFVLLESFFASFRGIRNI